MDGPRTVNSQLLKHYLLRWYEIDTNLDSLSISGKIKAKTLYSSLKQLSEQERKFLAEKYRVHKRLTDEVLSGKHGLTFKEYREKRIEIEDKLKPIMQVYVNQYHEAFRKALEEEFSEEVNSR